MAGTLPTLPPPPPSPPPAATTLASNLLSFPAPRPRLAATHRRQVVVAASSRPPPPPSPERGDGDDEEEQEVERAMGMDGGIPGTFGELLRHVSSRAYGMWRHLMESLDSLAYDGLRVVCNTCVTFPSSFCFDNLGFY